MTAWGVDSFNLFHACRFGVHETPQYRNARKVEDWADRGVEMKAVSYKNLKIIFLSRKITMTDGYRRHGWKHPL